MNTKIGILVGSLRTDSVNRRLAKALIRLAPVTMSLQILEIGALPHYNEDDEAAPPSAVREFREAIDKTDGIIFVTPEYNRSVPGVLKNAIDQGSRPKGASVWSGRPAGVIGASPGVLGSCMAQQHLRNILAAVDMPTLGHPEAYVQLAAQDFDEAGSLIDESKTRFVQSWLQRFDAWQQRMHLPLAA
ncbi:Chromate reductase [Xylophilus ampelinus]|uniref:NADPH-dependent FMN reductase n=1 Tax=Variovorax paradoxus TaxID=34073 RepID=A0A2W5QN89_VARPD|nr:MAG: NADPH-dependent FMN reductase [Variovorax paradoxus]VTY39065.1 Chromate reductase [Xylophilus ampelinus]